MLAPTVPQVLVAVAVAVAVWAAANKKTALMITAALAVVAAVAVLAVMAVPEAAVEVAHLPFSYIVMEEAEALLIVN